MSVKFLRFPHELNKPELNEWFGKKKPVPETPADRLKRMSDHADSESEYAWETKAHPKASVFHDEDKHDALVDKGYVDPEDSRGNHIQAHRAHHAAAEEALKQGNYELAKHHIKHAEKHENEVHRINTKCDW